MKPLVECLIVGSAGFCGAVLRFLVQNACVRLLGTGFPIGTMLINVSGSCFLGWFLAMHAGRLPVSDNVRLAVAVGFVGAYTTFSTWAYDSHLMFSGGEALKGTLNVLGSMTLGLLAVHIGIYLAGKS